VTKYNVQYIILRSLVNNAACHTGATIIYCFRLLQALHPRHVSVDNV